MNWIKKIWKDQVGSKVIAAGIIFLLSQFGILIWSLSANLNFIEVYKNIFVFFKTEYLIKGWHLMTLYSLFLVSVIFILQMFYRKIDKKSPQHEIKHNVSENKEPDEKNENEPPTETVIHEAPTVFFHYRLCDAFPGFSNGYKWFKSKRDIHNRLKILLEQPLAFDKGEGYGIDTRPIWWFRGHSALPIVKFKVLNRQKALMNIEELKIEKIAAYRGHSYFQDFIYVQCKADSPTGLYEHNLFSLEARFEENGEYQEEFGIFKKRLITRQEYDDGSAVIKGKPIRTDGAELRSRTLIKYNFIITSKFSPYNCQEFSIASDVFFGKLLKNEITFDEFILWMEKFPKNQNDQ
ncbi:MAG: hypothetical protein GXO79_05135 [Chlorobi bacterium]|nr:hypothetical protein [Chlorobiota bacterium]